MAEQYFKIRQSFQLTQLLVRLVANQAEKMSGSALQLLLIFIKEFTETNSPNMRIPLKKFVSTRGMTDAKYARKQLTQDIAQLVKVRLCTGICGIENSVLCAELGTALLSMLPQSQFMWLPLDVLRTQKNENIAARLLLTWRICQHKRMNLDRKNADTVSVSMLLESCPSIPTPTQIGDSGQIGKRIIEPFEKTLDRCTTFLWQYAGDSPSNYATFLQSRLQIIWQNDPYADSAALKSAKSRRRVKGRNKDSKDNKTAHRKAFKLSGVLFFC